MTLARLQDNLGYHFQNLSLLDQALVHRSVRHRPSYERLEYLGDSLLNTIVSYWLYQNSTLPEGVLSQQRSLLVCEAALCHYAQKFQIAEFLQCAPEVASKPSIIADSFEAICAAIFLDSHWDTLRSWLETNLAQEFLTILSQSQTKDPKTQLQEYTQSQKQNLPNYILTKQTGSEHQPLFEITCQYQKYHVKGVGPSKKQAEQNAAKAMLDLLTSHTKRTLS